jgi:hypothetical protein
VSTATTPCDLHELTNCSICTGADKRHEASLQESEYDRGALPRLPGGPTIHAKFSGSCAGCGRRYPAGTPIHHSSEYDGWIGVECCA